MAADDVNGGFNQFIAVDSYATTNYLWPWTTFQ